MLKIYNTDIETNKIEEIKEFKKGSWISLVNPSENEIKKVCENVKIQEDFIRDALDFEEKARIDNEEDDGTTLFVVDVPIIEKSEENDVYTTMPLGMIVVRDDFFITVSLRKNKVIEDFEKRKIKNFQTYKKSKLIFQILYLNSSYYLTYLKQINKETYDDYEYSLKEVDTKYFNLKKYTDPDVRYYACVVDKNRAGAKPKVLFRLNLAYNRWEELGYLRMKQQIK